MTFRLLVEGPDDLHLIKNLSREHGLNFAERSEIHECGGMTALLGEVLPAHLRAGSYDEEPGTPLGMAVTKRYFDAHTSAATEFVGWLRRLLDAS